MGLRHAHLAHLGHAQVKNTPVGNIGVTICYDLRFPELYTALRCPSRPPLPSPLLKENQRKPGAHLLAHVINV